MSHPSLQQSLQNALADYQAGRFPQAESHYRQILMIHPQHSDSLHMLGVIAGQTGRLRDAANLIRQAIALSTPNPLYFSNLGAFLQQQGQLDEAIHYCRQALALNPNYPDAHNNLANALRDKGCYDEALASYQQALALSPHVAEIHYNVGHALHRQGQLDQAIASYRQALALNPNLAPAHNNLGAALNDKGQLDQALASYQKALLLNPAFADAHDNLGNAWRDKGQLDQALASYQQALRLNPAFVDAHDNLLLMLPFHPASTPQSLFAENQRWNKIHAQPLRPFITPHSNNPNPNRPLRIGYVSPEFDEHPVGRFLLPLLAAHDRASFQIFCYANIPPSPSRTVNLQAHSDIWRNIVGLSHQQAADLIRQDQIDILVDLAWHAANNRLLVFARKPAPVQVSYLGHVAGTALDTIDYRLTDCHLDPHEEEDQYYMQKPFRLNGTYWCYQSPAIAPPVNDLPALTAGKITFGCLNNFCKVTTPTLETWSALLQQLPHSRLLLNSPPGNHRDQLRQFMQDRGITPDRLELVARTPLHDYFKTHHQIDIALDPFPYNGGTTTCDALWMGLPVITLTGQTPVARAGVSLLSSVGLPELITHTPDQYIQLAVALANDLPRLQNLRATLRQRMLNSPLMNAPLFAKNIEQAYRTMWQTWCNARTPSTSNP